MAQIESVSSELVRSARNAPFLEREDEHQLAVLWKEQRDDAALHKLAQAHMRLVIAMAYRFRHYGLPVSELVQEGHIGLLEAAARFDPSREVRFSTYATWWIRASIQDFILRNWSIVRGGTSSNQKSLFFNLRRLRAKISQISPERNSREAFGDIARALGVSVSDVETMNTRLAASDASLNAPVYGEWGEESSEFGDFLIDPTPTPDIALSTSLDSERHHKWLEEALATLNQREIRILRARRLQEESATLETLGEELNISKERVRQIENRAMEKIRDYLQHTHPEAFAHA